MDSNINIEKLYHKFLAEELSPEELEILLKYFEESDPQKIRSLIQAALAEEPEVDQATPDLSALYSKIQTRLQTHTVKPTLTLWRKKWFPYAAAAVVLFSCSMLWYKNQQGANENLRVEHSLKDVQPGGNRASITFSNGKQLTLDSTQSALMTVDGDYVYANGEAIMESPVDFAIVNTPVGGTYQITLPDETRVWLNAESSIKYPSVFGSSREVYVTGEVYFEVAKKVDAKNNRLPFIVHTAKQAIEVTGTKFNVNAYGDEENEVTTLMEGAVNIKKEGRTQGLKPGEQALVGQTTINTRQVDASKYIAWKLGYFDFTDMGIKEVMKQVSRWYNVKVSYEGELPNVEFFGSIERNNNFSIVLALLETNSINYRLEGKTVIISQKNGGRTHVKK